LINLHQLKNNFFAGLPTVETVIVLPIPRNGGGGQHPSPSGSFLTGGRTVVHWEDLMLSTSAAGDEGAQEQFHYEQVGISLICKKTIFRKLEIIYLFKRCIFLHFFLNESMSFLI
jgi:hypothetical protein